MCWQGTSHGAPGETTAKRDGRRSTQPCGAISPVPPSDYRRGSPRPEPLSQAQVSSLCLAQKPSLHSRLHPPTHHERRRTRSAPSIRVNTLRMAHAANRYSKDAGIRLIRPGEPACPSRSRESGLSNHCPGGKLLYRSGLPPSTTAPARQRNPRSGHWLAAFGDARSAASVSVLRGIASQDQMSIFSAISIASSTSMPR